jgi:hypothetical protein
MIFRLSALETLFDQQSFIAAKALRQVRRDDDRPKTKYH